MQRFRTTALVRGAGGALTGPATAGPDRRKWVLEKSIRRQSRGAKAFKGLDSFPRRHIGPTDGEVDNMLNQLGRGSLPELIDSIVPESIRFRGELFDNGGVTESELLEQMKGILSANRSDITSMIGMGYYNTKTPLVILRNLLENPGWYTPYTPYQPEISQGRLESLLNFQTMLSDLTGLPIAGASLLDEATAAGELVALMRSHSKGKRRKLFADENLFPQTLEVLRTRAVGMGVTVEVGRWREAKLSEEYGLVLVQYPDCTGAVEDYGEFFKEAKSHGCLCAVAADVLALCLLQPPSHFGADVAVGSTQRFGVPMGYGGPHAGYLACKESLKRMIPGRIVGIAKDVHGDLAYRTALQTREQHIKRDRATSNICTAQALLANISAMYAVYHGPKGLREIAEQVHLKAKALAVGLEGMGYRVVNEGGRFFDTLTVEVGAGGAREFSNRCREGGVNVFVTGDSTVRISTDEEVEDKHLLAILSAGPERGEGPTDLFALKDSGADRTVILPSMVRPVEGLLQYPAFNTYHNETDMMRYLRHLQGKDMGLDIAMIPLGSCTMKLNAAAEMIPVTWEENGRLHPFVPVDQAQGTLEVVARLEDRLKEITGFDAVSFQPNSGAQGEYSGLRAIQAYHESIGEGQRDVCLIPVSAHGTNPASAVISGMRVVTIETDQWGNISKEDVAKKVEEAGERLACCMITYPSTYGVYEMDIKEICSLIHKGGGQVYIDGANLNAQLGLTRVTDIGGDVCHMNLHKTFCIPHGGGGPGVGPIGVRSHLAPFLPGHSLMPSRGGSAPFGQVAGAGHGSASILPITLAFIELMNGDGLKRSAEIAILSANYLAHRLKDAYPILYSGPQGLNAHEFILDLRPFKKTAGVEAEDVAKRLMDYGMHAPTLSFPVNNTLMIEPTESEPLSELDRLVEALHAIREEIREVEEGKQPKGNNLLSNAPHTAKCVTGNDWDRPYSREQAAYPTPFTKTHKFWPSVGRVDQAFGDRNFVCTCPPIEAYTD